MHAANASFQNANARVRFSHTIGDAGLWGEGAYFCLKITRILSVCSRQIGFLEWTCLDWSVLPCLRQEFIDLIFAAEYPLG